MRKRIAVIAALVIGASLVGAAPAFAGETGPPQAAGYVTFSSGTTTVSCTQGAPTAVGFAFHWNSADSRHDVTVRYEIRKLVTDAHGNEFDRLVLSKQLTFRPHRTGVFDRTYRVAHIQRGQELSVGVTPETVAKGRGDYFYVGERGAATCGAHPPTAKAPVVTMVKKCSGAFVLVFENHGAKTWDWTAFYQGHGFQPGGNRVIRPHSTRKVREAYSADLAKVQFVVQVNAAGGTRSSGIYWTSLAFAGRTPAKTC